MLFAVPYQLSIIPFEEKVAGIPLTAAFAHVGPTGEFPTSSEW